MNALRGRIAPLRHTTFAAHSPARGRGLGFPLLGLLGVLALAVLTGWTSAAGTAHAALPGTNGLIACSGPLGPNPPPTGGSFLEIFTMDGSGAIDASGAPTSQVRLQNNTTSDFNPRFSADGTQIAFVKNNDVWKMNADGTNETQLTGLTPPISLDSFVGGWSPDGSKIVFQRSNPAAGGNPANFEVFTIDADGTDLTNVSNNPGSATVGSSDSQPSFSPDGTRIAFQSNRRGNPDIWVMNADGTGARPLTADSLAEESAPEFSPDGQQIAFQSDRGMIPRTTGRNLEIYRMSSRDGSNVTRLTFNDYNPAASGGETTSNLSGFDLNPHWSPAGDRIVFHSGRGIEFDAAQWDAFTVLSSVGENPSGGTAAVRLTRRANNDERCGWSVATPHNLLSVAKAGSGEGTVTSTPAGIVCGDDCAQGFADNTVVTLTAAPAANGSTFTGFSGNCVGAGLTCDVTVDDAKTVTATFADPNPTLTVTKDGSGARKAGTGVGTVTSAPAGIDCGLDCSEEYASGTSVTLTAAPAAGSTFDGFTGGGCSGTGTTCTVTVDAAKTVTAIFSGPLLTVTKTGDGAGSLLSGVSSSPAGVSCGIDCSEDYTAGTVVTLTASASTSTVAGGFGATFTGFTGCDSTPTATTCTVTMSAAKTVTANFVDFPTLTVTKTGTGTGTVTSAPAGLSCGATCTRDFPKDSTVTLTAAPAAGSAFEGFTGCATTPTATTCTVSVDAAKTVTARFIVPRTLTVAKAGTGAGTVTSAPAGIDCGAVCTQDYDTGASVTLTAAPTAATSTFTGFTGCATTPTATTCTVTMDAAKTVTATFTLIPRLLTVAKAGTGTGTVTSVPAGISCGTDCTEPYGHGTSVTLTAVPTAGTSTFTGFTGAGCTGTGTTCTVTMDAAKTATATFALIPRTLTVTKAGAGAGTVTSNPTGVTCGDDCTEAYGHGTLVSVSANPAAGSTFAGFSGAGCSGTGTTCQVLMDQAQGVTATFTLGPVAPPPPPPPSVVPPPPPPPPAAVPPPPPAVTAARRRARLGASVTPARDLRAPFVFRISGRLTLPNDVTRTQGCRGRVSVQIKRGGTTISTRRVFLTRSCTYSLRVSFANRVRFRTSTRLRFTARFLGNARVFPATAPARFARVRR